MKKLDFTELLSGAFANSLKNFPSLVGCVALWLLTIWIPYVNVGTTIAIITLPAALSKGKIINPLDIFDQKYYKYMGEFFLVSGLKVLILYIAFAFVIVPGIVMSIAYSLSALLVIDKGKGASEALKLSNKLTFGNKWIIFLAQLVLCIGTIILLWIASMIHGVVTFIFIILIIPVFLGLKASIYGPLTDDIEEES